MKLALVQMAVTANKNLNIQRAKQFISKAATEGAQLICLPECFNSPYGSKYFPEYAESVPSGPTTNALSESAKEYGVYLLGGSFPERDNGMLFNTCLAFGPEGNLLMKYRKTHLFDIDIPGKITFKESETLSPGNALGTVETPFCKIGVGICYDIRFPKLAEAYSKEDCQLLLYPGAFNMTTGPLHWELLQRARATDNQLFVATISPARDESASYVAWGHSMVVDPWARVMQSADEKEQIVYADLDFKMLKDVRSQIPIRHQERNELYTNN